MTDLSTVKLEYNHKVAFNLADDKVESILCFGDTVNFFGFVNDGSLDIMHMNDNDRNHYLWLLKQVKQGAVVYVVGQEEEKEYYAQLFDVMGSLGVKVKWKYTYVDHPDNYTEKNLGNIKFDYVFGGLVQNNESFSFGKNIVNTINKLYDIYNKKMYVVATNDLWQSNLPKSYSLVLTKISPKLHKITNCDHYRKSDKEFMTLYEFGDQETETIPATTVIGDEYILKSLTDKAYFSEYEKKFMKYFENKNQLEYFYLHFSKKTKCKMKQSPYYVRTRGVFHNPNFFNKGAKIIFTEEEMLNFVQSEHKVANNGISFCVPLYEAAKNLTTALSNPLMRLICYRTKNKAFITKETHKYIIDIDWEDPRTTNDKWLLIMLGCPKDEAQEYAEYCKAFINEIVG